MAIFSRYNLVLLAVPKTGSTALEVALGQEADGRFGSPPEMKHLPLYRYNPSCDLCCSSPLGRIQKPLR